VKTINDHGMEVVSGIILGFDTDTPQTCGHLLDFIAQSQIPLLTINLLQALPKTPLWDRLAREGRLVEDDTRDSNVVFRMPYDEVVAGWRSCMRKAYAPDKLYERFQHHVEHTVSNRLRGVRSPSWRDVKRGLIMFARILWFVGLRSDYKAVFWRFALPRLVRGDIESVIAVSMVAHHLILFAREASTGLRNASHYSMLPDPVVVPR
jgi:radical SAM superfamily enzyme YgiQ (UPF0313 family)